METPADEADHDVDAARAPQVPVRNARVAQVEQRIPTRRAVHLRSLYTKIDVFFIDKSGAAPPLGGVYC